MRGEWNCSPSEDVCSADYRIIHQTTFASNRWRCERIAG